MDVFIDLFLDTSIKVDRRGEINTKKELLNFLANHTNFQDNISI